MRLTMVFGGGPSPMSLAGCAARATSQPFLRDRPTSVPSTVRQAHPQDAAERGDFASRPSGENSVQAVASCVH